MADPDLKFFDGAGDEIIAPIDFPTATPNTPTAVTVLEIRNNDGGASPVDPARNTVFTVLAALKDSGDEPGTELAYIVQAALRVAVTAVSEGSTATLRGPVPLGAGRTVSLNEIPDGGTVTLELHTNAPSGASLQAISLSLSVESIQSVALDQGHYAAHGNYVLAGAPGGEGTTGGPDPLFFALFSETGDWTVSGVADGKVNTPTNTVYVRAGVTETWMPVPAEVEYDDLDSAAAPLIALNGYYVGITLAAGGGITETKGLQAALPLQDADKPVTPLDEQLRLWVVVPFGLLIAVLEFEDIEGFFGFSVVSGTTVSISAGRGVVDGRAVDDQTRTNLVLPDDGVTLIYRQPESGYELVDVAASPTDPHAMPIWQITTVGGVVTLEGDLRRIGAAPVPVPAVRVLGGLGHDGTGGVHFAFPGPGVFLSWTSAVTTLAQGGMATTPGAGIITVPTTGKYLQYITVNAAAPSADSGDVISAGIYINGAVPPSVGKYSVPDVAGMGDTFLLVAAAAIPIDLIAGDEYEIRLASDKVGGGGTLSLAGLDLILELI